MLRQIHLRLLAGLVLGLLLLESCGSQELPTPIGVAAQAVPTPTGVAVTAAVAPTPTGTPNSTPFRLGGPHPTTQISQVKQEWANRLNQAKQKWVARNLTSYDLKVSVENTTWEPIYIFSISVRNNSISQKKNEITRTENVCCEKATPPVTLADFDGNKYSIPGLFDIAYDRLNAPWPEDTLFFLEFDSVYGYPTQIILDNDRYSDTQKIWKVLEFSEVKL